MNKVIDLLIAEDHLAEDQRDNIEKTVRAKPGSLGNRWYLGCLVGCGSWISALFFFGSCITFTGLILGDNVDEDVVSWWIRIIGFMSIGGSLLVKRSILEEDRRVFVTQILLAIAFMGEFLFLVSFLILDDSNLVLWAIWISLTIFYIIYDDFILRFLNVLMSMVVVYLLFIHNTFEFGPRPELIYSPEGVVALAGLSLVVLWLPEFFFATTTQLYKFTAPLRYALPIGWLGILLIAQVDSKVQDRLDGLGIITVALLVSFVGYLLTQYKETIKPPVMALIGLGACLIAVPALFTPGIPATLLILLMGFYFSNRILFGIGAVGTVAFVIVFYYNLETTLLVKSYILMASGLIFLFLRFLLVRYTKQESFA